MGLEPSTTALMARCYLGLACGSFGCSPGSFGLDGLVGWSACTHSRQRWDEALDCVHAEVQAHHPSTNHPHTNHPHTHQPSAGKSHARCIHMSTRAGPFCVSLPRGIAFCPIPPCPPCAQFACVLPPCLQNQARITSVHDRPWVRPRLGRTNK